MVRALVAFAVGALIIKYREDTVHWLTVVIGALFFVSGIISVVLNRRPTSLPKGGDSLSSSESNVANQTPSPREGGGGWLSSLVGFGSIILGIILALMPTTFITGLQYVLAAMLVLGAVNQFVNLAQASRWCHVGWFYWLLPVVVLLVAIFMIWRPIEVAAAPLFIIGWCMLLYGAAELLGTVMVWKAGRVAKRMAEQKMLEEQAAKEPELIEEIVEEEAGTKKEDTPFSDDRVTLTMME